MNVDCFYCLRYLLMLIIFLNMILGLTLLGASLWTLLDGARMGNVFADTEGFNYILYFLIVLGFVKFLLGFLGCSSVAKKNSRMLTTFFSLMLIVFLGQVAAGLWLYVDESKVTATATGSLADFIQEHYDQPEYTRKTQALDNLQSQFTCCGSNGPDDWSTSVYNNAANDTTSEGAFKVPPSCCISNETTVCDFARSVQGPILEYSIYEKGCISMIVEKIHNYGTVILGVVGGVILIELFVMTSTLILCRSKNVRYSL